MCHASNEQWQTTSNWRCGTMWVVRQTDDFFVCFGVKPNKGLRSRSPTRPVVGEERQVREKPEGQLAKELREGQSAKGDAEKQSTSEGRGERSALSGLSRECQNQQKSERRLLKPDELHRGWANQREKMSALLVPFCWSFAQNTRPC